ncbi:MAG: sulfurtransferase [Thermomicrobiales bacterium]
MSATPLEHDWPGTLVETDWLAAHLGHQQLRIIDMRGYVKTSLLGDGKQRAEYTGARDEYDAGHIPGAVFIDWTSDITDPDDPVPAQLAPPERFAALMSRLGIGDDDYVVLYDHKGTQFATRGWWALGYYGHDRAAVLNGGWNKWAAEGRPVSTETPAPARATFTPRQGRQRRETAQEVLEHSQLGDALIIDARDHEQYSGAIARGKQGGHVPGARLLPNATLFTPQGTWKSDAELRAALADAGITEQTEQPVVAYCNGGVAATTVLFAMDRLGLNGANYDGSWNEWGNNLDLPAHQGDKP